VYLQTHLRHAFDYIFDLHPKRIAGGKHAILVLKFKVRIHIEKCINRELHAIYTRLQVA
jgi:hypothetical protein